MANASSTLRGVAHFTYGTELELLFRPKKSILDYLATKKFNLRVRPGDSGAEKNRTIFMESMAAWLREAGLSATSIDGDAFDKINVKREPKLEDRRHEEGDASWAMEIVFPTTSTSGLELHDMLNLVYQVFERHCEITWTTGTSQHVHVKPHPGPNAPQGTVPEWTIQQSLSLLRATAVFDQAITKIMPKDRKENVWARSSFHDIELEQALRTNNARGNAAGDEPTSEIAPQSTLRSEARKLVGAFGEVPTRSWDHLFKYFDDNVKMTAHYGLNLGQNSRVSWNLMHLQGKCGTVEFRRPPGALSAMDAQRWVIFAVAFASASLEEGWEDKWRSRTDHATVSELQAFIKRGLRRLDEDWQNGLNPEESFVEIPVEAELESN